MAEFEVLVHKVNELIKHPAADTLDIIKVGNYQIIIKHDSLQIGDTFAYIPEQSIVPDTLLAEMGLTGKLHGSKNNRVKAIKLRGILSQGLAYPINKNPGKNVTELLGITKYEAPIPMGQRGEVDNRAGKTLNYDIENIKKYPNLFIPNENIVITEKLHGTWACMGMYEDTPIVTSKGQSAKGLTYKLDQHNTWYISTWDSLKNRIIPVMNKYKYWYILGEIFGKGVQDLHYNLETPEFRIFDIYIGKPQTGTFLNWTDIKQHAKDLNIKTVPELYSGPYDETIINNLTQEKHSSLDKGTIREGIVITADPNRVDPIHGRAKLKSINETYLLRKGVTTEFQ